MNSLDGNITKMHELPIYPEMRRDIDRAPRQRLSSKQGRDRTRSQECT